MSNPRVASILLRVGLASVFLYAAAASTLEPYNWLGYIPQFLRNMFPSQILLMGFSIYELLLALWILSGKKIIYSASLASFTLVAIMVSNFSQMDILFRDIAILFAALSLIFLPTTSEQTK